MAAPEPPPRRLDRLALSIILLCVGFTLPSLAVGKSIEAMGALRPSLFWQGEYWRALTTVLLHGGWLHLAVNCLSVYFLAVPVRVMCGSAAVLLFLAGGAMAGLSASLLWDGSNYFRVGISGGVVALLALLLALEWALSRSFREFIGRRNTLVVLFFVALNAALAVYIEKNHGASVRLDHAAHVGGFAFGLLGGLATYSRRGLRRMRGAFAFLVLALLPIAYAAHPFRNIHFLEFRAALAEREGEPAAIESAYAALRRMRPEHLAAGARLALLRNDPSYLDGLERPMGNWESRLFVTACLDLALARLESAPAEAASLVERAAETLAAPAEPWLAFAEHAHALGAAEMALRGRAEALQRMRETDSWRVAASLLDSALLKAAGPEAPTEGRAAASKTAVEWALRAAAGLAESGGVGGEEELATALEKELVRVATVIGAIEPSLGEGERESNGLGEDRSLRQALSALWRRIADNTANRRTPAYRLKAAQWKEREMAGLPDTEGEVEALYRGSYLDAKELSDPVVMAEAAQWLRAHDRPIPGGELGDEGGGG